MTRRTLAGSTPFWILLFLIRTAGLLIGLDRLPMVPTVNPEVIINDPAVSLSRGHGLVGFSFEHSVNGLDRFYAHFPPVFLWLQALVFRLFGFSAISFRALSVACDLATCAVFLLVIRELLDRGILDRVGATLAGVLILLEPTTMVHAREARMESLTTFFGVTALLFCIRAGQGEAVSLARWLWAGLFIGLALATHPAAALMWVVFEGWTLLEFRQLGFRRWIAVNAVAPVVMLIGWLIAYGARIPDAIAQVRHFSTYTGGPDLRVLDLFQSIHHGAVLAAQNAGGLGLIFTLITVPLAIWRTFDSRPAPTEWRRTLIALISIVLVQMAMVGLIIPRSGMNRAVTIFPFVMLCAGLAFSHMGEAAHRRIVAVGVLAAAMQFGAIAFYLVQLRHGWDGRSPDRFDSIVAATPADAKVAGPPELWYGFLHRDRQFAIIYRELGEEAFWNSPNAFDSYDVVILDPNWPHYAEWRQKAAAHRPVSRMVHTYQRDFLVIAKSLNGN